MPPSGTGLPSRVPRRWPRLMAAWCCRGPRATSRSCAIWSRCCASPWGQRPVSCPTSICWRCWASGSCMRGSTGTAAAMVAKSVVTRRASSGALWCCSTAPSAAGLWGRAVSSTTPRLPPPRALRGWPSCIRGLTRASRRTPSRPMSGARFCTAIGVAVGCPAARAGCGVICISWWGGDRVGRTRQTTWSACARPTTRCCTRAGWRWSTSRTCSTSAPTLPL